MAQFAIRDFSFTYPGGAKPALSRINLEIEPGQYVLLCGKSGSGKTTLMRQLKPTLAPHGKAQGELLFHGRPLGELNLREQSARIGFVMQNPDSQIVTDKVWHELAFGLESLGCEQEAIRLRVAEMASYFGIQSWFHKRVSELSGGQKQLLNLASIMAMQPDALVLDEPTSQLDPIAAADFLNTLRRLNLDLGVTIILSEHRLETVFPCADRVVVLEEGCIIAQDTPRAVGERLRQLKSDMFAALPAPARIYYGVGDRSGCPLTVREGRSWLSSAFSAAPPRITRLPSPPPLGEVEHPAVEVRDAWFRYDREAPDVLKGASLRIPQGELSAVVGGNGAGKSTMLKAICNLCRPYRGRILVQGKPVERYGADLFRGCLAMLPQDPQSLFVGKSVRRDLAEMLPRLTQGERERRLAAVAASCGLEGLLDAHPYDLSGGEQQRAALAKVLLCEPRILLLDEPTKGMDPFFKTRLAEILANLKRQGVTLVMVSHDVEFCAKYADRVSLFFDGAIAATGVPSQFFAQNSFYTTAANRMSRHLFPGAVTEQDVVELWRVNRSAAGGEGSI